MIRGFRHLDHSLRLLKVEVIAEPDVISRTILYSLQFLKLRQAVQMSRLVSEIQPGKIEREIIIVVIGNVQVPLSYSSVLVGLVVVPAFWPDPLIKSSRQL